MHVHQHRQAVFAQRIDAFGHILRVGHGHLNAFRAKKLLKLLRLRARSVHQQNLFPRG